MSSADHLVLGDWNIRCDACGRKLKGSQARQMWNGNQVCQRCWEPRQPQDFVRAIVENPTPPFVRDPADTFLAYGDAIVLETDTTGLTYTVPDQSIEYILLETGTWIISET